ncbi:NAD(+) hydrolase TirS-like [Saccoglossus kowalevskii]
MTNVPKMPDVQAFQAQSDLTQMKRLCKGDRILPDDVLEAITNANDLFPRLKGDGPWTKNDVEFLVDLLTKSDRVDLATELQQYWSTLKGNSANSVLTQPLPPTRRPSESPDYDVFLTYTESDKEKFVDPLSMALKSSGCSVYIDCRNSLPTDEVKLTNILIKSKILVFVISESVLSCGFWTRQELGSYLQLGIPVYPFWLGVTREQVKKLSPYLAGVLAERYGEADPLTEQDFVQFAQKIKDKVDTL